MEVDSVLLLILHHYFTMHMIKIMLNGNHVYCLLFIIYSLFFILLFFRIRSTYIFCYWAWIMIRIPTSISISMYYCITAHVYICISIILFIFCIVDLIILFHFSIGFNVTIILCYHFDTLITLTSILELRLLRRCCYRCTLAIAIVKHF